MKVNGLQSDLNKAQLKLETAEHELERVRRDRDRWRESNAAITKDYHDLRDMHDELAFSQVDADKHMAQLVGAIKILSRKSVTVETDYDHLLNYIKQNGLDK